ncbi:Uncharacterised protein [Mycobacteroides abscessus subsp. abscessus]|nr:Uncharacterised protein [Mycobacteroides abscessus subsp. abscessus]
MTDLFLLLIGRDVHLDRLVGPGVPQVQDDSGRLSTG